MSCIMQKFSKQSIQWEKNYIKIGWKKMKIDALSLGSFVG
jgi:hypothetical protein